MKENLRKILQKPMDRRDFLKFSGMSLLVLAGFGSIVKLVQPQLLSGVAQKGVSPQGPMAYGAMPYGGKKTV